MKKNFILFFLVVFFISSCTKLQHKKLNPFEKEFELALEKLNANVALPDGAKQKILEEYGTPENWVNASIAQRQLLLNKKTNGDIILNYAPKMYHISLKPKGFNAHYMYCPEDVYILDKAEELCIPLPYSCRAGGCSSCVANMITGQVDQSEQSFLNDAQIDRGYVLLCVAYPKANSGFRTWCEDELY